MFEKKDGIEELEECSCFDDTIIEENLKYLRSIADIKGYYYNTSTRKKDKEISDKCDRITLRLLDEIIEVIFDEKEEEIE